MPLAANARLVVALSVLQSAMFPLSVITLFWMYHTVPALHEAPMR